MAACEGCWGLNQLCEPCWQTLRKPRWIPRNAEKTPGTYSLACAPGSRRSATSSAR